MDRELRRLKVEGTKGLQDSQKTARELSLEYETLTRRIAEHKERVVKDVLKALEELVEFKASVSRGFEEIEGKISSELKEAKERDVRGEFKEDEGLSELCEEVKMFSV